MAYEANKLIISTFHKFSPIVIENLTGFHLIIILFLTELSSQDQNHCSLALKHCSSPVVFWFDDFLSHTHIQ